MKSNSMSLRQKEMVKMLENIKAEKKALIITAEKTRT